MHVWLVLKAIRAANVDCLPSQCCSCRTQNLLTLHLAAADVTDRVMLHVKLARKQWQSRYRAGKREHIM